MADSEFSKFLRAVNAFIGGSGTTRKVCQSVPPAEDSPVPPKEVLDLRKLLVEEHRIRKSYQDSYYARGALIKEFRVVLTATKSELRDAHRDAVINARTADRAEEKLDRIRVAIQTLATQNVSDGTLGGSRVVYRSFPAGLIESILEEQGE